MHRPNPIALLMSLFGLSARPLPPAAAPRSVAPAELRYHRWSRPTVHDRPRPPAPGTQFCPELEALGAEVDGATLQRALSLASSLKREQVRRVRQMARQAGQSHARYLLDVAAAA
jgi:hypothetical protein